ncbi:MAG: TonB family protein [Acidobacteriota bacterium]|nr:TonB family protein [Acidobacteriota bacterium]
MPSSPPPDLNLLLDWPGRQSGPRRTLILGASLAIHALFFSLATQLPSFVQQGPPERRVIFHKVPLYLPPDLLTQKAPNLTKPTKSFDLADLTASRGMQARPSSPEPTERHFEIPKVAPLSQQKSKTAPQIVPEAPKMAMNQPPSETQGSPSGLSSNLPPPPAPANGPFQNVGSEPLIKNPHPTIAIPKASVQSAIQSLAEPTNSAHVAVSDDNASPPRSGSPGIPGQLSAQHATVELQSDPEGADFRAYLAQILGIVRTNWRRIIPESVRMGTLRGRTVVEFIINRDGSIPKLVTADPSGSEALDRAAVAGLSMSNPLPPLPADFKGNQVRLAFSFGYNTTSQ